jgi:dihydrodipicolinate synthase/N-acetylneuraminate lyase
MAEVAKDLGAIAVLLPPPSYFHFDTLDLPEMIQQVAESLPLPVLLYHLPQFTNNLGASEALDLVRSAGNIVGIKDSSGHRETLEEFAAAKHTRDFILMAGSDDLFLVALELSADGGISGLSCVFPELMLGVYHAFREGDLQRAAALQSLVQELATAVAQLPTPWGIKIALEAQGFHTGSLSWPLSSRLAARAVRFRQWFEKWAPLARERLSDSSSRQLENASG